MDHFIHGDRVLRVSLLLGVGIPFAALDLVCEVKCCMNPLTFSKLFFM